MEGIELEEPYFSLDEDNGDFCSSILSRFGNSTDESHQHLCAVIGAMSQELKEQNLPTTHVAYFGGACSSLDRLSSEPDAPNHIVDALLTILSIVISRVPVAILKKKRDFLSRLLVQVLRSPSMAETSIIAGLKCVSHLLIYRDSLMWSDVSQLFSVLLGFVIDSRPKVRRQSHLCLRDVLLSFQKSSLLVSASEGITSLFERFLLLAGGENACSGEGPKGAQQVLYILDSLKECLPLMSLKCKNSILKYFKTLLDLHQPLVTRRITDGLSFLCLYPASEVSPEALLELLNSLALSISTNEMSGDVMTFTARLLDVGMNKVFTLNRQICVIKLPIVFNALKDILSSEHEEAIYAATGSFKSLIHSCIDESLIKQGVDQISLALNAHTSSRRSGPTIIEKVCATVESLLDYHFDSVWDRVFQVVSAMFHKLGDQSTYFMRGIVKNLADLQKLPDEDFPFRKQLHECLGAALVAMGPETFLSLLPLNLKADDLSNANVWLFPILKHYTVGARLSFFTEEILSMIKHLRRRSRQFELQGLMVSSRNADALAHSLWSLLPSFCNYPLDTAERFMDLGRTLCIKLKDEPDIRGIICTSLQLLIQQNKKILDEKDGNQCVGGDMACEHGLVRYTKQVATSNLNVLRSSAQELLTALSNVLLKSTKDDGGCLQLTIGEIASISDREVISMLFKRAMLKLFKVTEEARKADNASSMHVDESSNNVSPSIVRAKLLDLAVSLLPGLDPTDIDTLYGAIKPTLQDVEGVVQKKGYKVLSVILRDSNEFIPSKLEELLALMVEVLPSCHISSKHHRLNCLYFLIIHVSKDNLEQRWREIISSFLTEIVLALKEANKKTRNRAYDILVEIGHVLGDEERGGNRDNLCEIFNVIAGGLVSETPHMISAATKGLARLAYEFSDLISTAFNLLPSTFLLLQRQNREIVKANLGLLKVLVAKSQAEWLQLHLKSMVDGLMKWQDNTKSHFKAKVKLLLEMLVRKCGLEAVKAVMPEGHMRLLTNIRKIKERKERKRGAKTEETRSCLSKAPTSRQSMWNHTKFFSDFDDEDSGGTDEEYLNTKTISKGGRSYSHSKSAASSYRSKMRRKKNLLEHLSDQSDDEPLDLLDRQKTISALKSSEHLKRKSRFDDQVEVDSEGRLIIREEGDQMMAKSDEPDLDTVSEADSHLSGKSGTQVKKRRKTLDSGWAYTGSEYASKKASGDVKRKDKLEPYAYWPLDRKMMSRRPQHRAVARKGMASVVKMAKKFEGKSASSVLSPKSLKLKRTKKGSKK
ncbi:RRP12-like protein [Neltuma alba]|uniref:RRP12-like protein n=1 Tax=Neltuma alba TaxID=207710 RepID=UPI0010A377B3|nr:RRP12-like protein [Prosopis alba]